MRACDFYKAVKPALDPVVKPLGFHSRDRFYYRIVNDVVQQFCLLYRNYNFTIRFDVVSVYEERGVLAEGYEVCRLINGTNEWLGLQMAEKENGELVNTGPCAADLLHPDLELCGGICADVVKRYLLPLFERVVDSRSAYRMLHEKEFAGQFNRVFDSFLFLLGMGEWEQALDPLTEYLSFPHGTDGEWNELWRLHDALKSFDVTYILDYMEKHEAAVCAALHWKRKVP